MRYISKIISVERKEYPDYKFMINYELKKGTVTMKKFLSLMLSLVLVLSLVLSAFAAEAVNAADKFTDVPADAWYLDELNYAVYNGYISGTSATEFSPDGILTRAQFVTILGRMVGVRGASALSELVGFTVKVSETFTDVKFGSYYFDYVEWAAKCNIMNGVGSGKFSPDTPITVEQMGVALANYLNSLGWTGINLSDYNFKPSAEYADALSVSAWATEGMTLMQKYGLLVVDANGNVNPHKSATRAECTVSIVRLAKAFGLGVVPVPMQKSDTAEIAAKKVHDALWSAGVIDNTMTQKEKAWVYVVWLKSTCEYDYALSSGCHTAYNAFVKGKAVCDGYTQAYNLLLETEGIECSIMKTPAHWWTAATLDGVLYNIDSTNVHNFSYDDFCMTPEEAWEYVMGILDF